MPIHKLYIDSRRRVRPDLNSHTDFSIQLPRTIEVPDSRAFVDSVHISNIFETIHENNRNIYVAEEVPLRPVLATANKLYVLEEIGAAQTFRVLTVPTTAPTSAAGFATNVATALNGSGKALSGNYTVAYNTSNNELTISNATSPGGFKIYTREVLLGMSSFGSTAITPTTLADISDTLGTVTGAIVPGDALNPIITTSGPGWHYRRIEIAQGVYDADELRLELKNKLNATGVSANMNVYDVTLTASKRYQIACPNTVNAKFKIYPRDYNDLNPFAFQGYDLSFLNAKDGYDILGIHGGSVLTGTHTTPILGLGHVNLQPFHTLFLHSELGLQGDSIGPDGQNSIIRRITLDQGYGNMIHDRYSMPFDYIKVAKRNIRQLHFRLTDVHGRQVSTYTGISFSIIFVPDEEE